MKGMSFLNKVLTYTVIAALVGMVGCASPSAGSSSPVDSSPAAEAEAAPASPQSPYYSGSGGQGISLTIIPPNATGLSEDLNYLPALVQGELVSNFSGYSAVSVRDRMSMDKQYAELLSGIYNDDAGSDLGHLIPTTHYLSGSIIKTATGYALQMSVTKTADKTTAASYSGTCTVEELDNLAGVRRASLELLKKMGVAVTAQTQTELSGAEAENRAKAQTALAIGLTAQRQGTEVTAASYYYQAAVYDPSLLEAVNRQSIMSADISSGNIGDNVRNDIRWRNDWVARLTETEQFFDNLFKNTSPSYGLFYLTALEQGVIDYRAGTVPLSFKINFHAFAAWFDLVPLAVLKDVRNGLNATNRANDWLLAGWPGRTVSGANPFQGRSKDFAVVFELVNSDGKVIGSQNRTLRGSWNFSLGDNPP